MTEHVHKWKAGVHLDGCHFYQWTYACSCGATASTYDERDVDADPYSTVWMLPDDAEEECARCQELLAGAKPKHERVIVEAGS